MITSLTVKKDLTATDVIRAGKSESSHTSIVMRKTRLEFECPNVSVMSMEFEFKEFIGIHQDV
jgi:hypothetical protein